MQTNFDSLRIYHRMAVRRKQIDIIVHVRPGVDIAEQSRNRKAIDGFGVYDASWALTKEVSLANVLPEHALNPDTTTAMATPAPPPLLQDDGTHVHTPRS
jgi:hypothetical protein